MKVLTAILVAVISSMLGYLIGVHKFKYERSWELKKEYYSNLMTRLSEIAMYSLEAAGMNLPVGGSLSDLSENEIDKLIKTHTSWLGKNLDSYGIFISSESIAIVETYLEQVRKHHFETVEEWGSWYEGDDVAVMDYLSEVFHTHHQLATDALAQLTASARRDLSLQQRYTLKNRLKALFK